MNKEAYDTLLADVVNKLQKQAVSDPFSATLNAVLDNPIGDSVRNAVNVAMPRKNHATTAIPASNLQPSSGRAVVSPFASMFNIATNNPIGQALRKSFGMLTQPFGRRPPGYGKPGLDRGAYSSASDFRRSISQAGARERDMHQALQRAIRQPQKRF